MTDNPQMTRNGYSNINDDLEIHDACEDAIIDKLGPAALTGGKISFYDVAHMFFKLGVEWQRN